MTRALLLFLLLGAPSLLAQTPRRTVAITIDDLPTISVLEQTEAGRQRLTTSLLASLRQNRVPAIGFVNENKLGPRGAPIASRVDLMRQWLAAGLELGNHTWSHLSLHQATLTQYEAEIVLGDSVLRTVMPPPGPRYFRHPFLHAGRDSLVRDSLQEFLAAHRYIIAPVTIDNADYIFAAAYDRKLAAGDSVAADSIAASYLRYTDSVFAYYERQSIATLGREPAQIFLMHANAMNARYFGGLAEVMRRRGYRFITLDEALKDPAYQHPDRWYGNGGISWIQRWALTDGKKGAFFAGEPEVPAWIERASRP